MKSYPWKPWTIKQAIPLIKKLEKVLVTIDVHVALGGGVLHKGKSNHDLDLILFPHNSNHPIRLAWLTEELQSLGWIRWRTKDQVHRYWKSKSLTDEKHVEIWEYEDRRIDLIIMGDTL